MKFSDPQFVSSKIFLIYERHVMVRKSLFTLEEKFEGAFLAPEILPIPDEAPAEIPRGIFRSKHGYSNLSISQIRSELTTNYDSSFNKDFNKCFDYMIKKSNLFDRFLSVVAVSQVGLGCSINFRLPSLDDDEKVLAEKLERKLLSGLMCEGGLYDLRLSLARVVRDKLFLNTNLNNYRKYSSSKPIISQNPRLCDLTLDEFGLEFSIELNDKYGYNKGDKSCSISDLEDFINTIKSEIEKVKGKILGGISGDK
ncbi:hypothetical protein SAMN05661003_11937 [Desulfuromonas thiophila]|uniref:TIGR04255 family protein n=2 Tax=Desulfuromonas thiophila TaxID=57664 RepID=A0A1G7ED99_9BACT|nr:hypothetical protein SAMN05661003_11937 [Desulfuromonas thiophila]